MKKFMPLLFLFFLSLNIIAMESGKKYIDNELLNSVYGQRVKLMSENEKKHELEVWWHYSRKIDTQYVKDSIATLVTSGLDVNSMLLGCGRDYSLLSCAAHYDDYNLVEFLINHGADVNQNSTRDRTPIFWAVSEKVAQLLIDHGADLYKIDENGESVLHHALDMIMLPEKYVVEKTKIPALVNFYLNKGVKACTSDKYGNTALHHLARKASLQEEDIECAKLLLQENNILDIKNKDSYTAKYYTELNLRDDETYKYLGLINEIELLKQLLQVMNQASSLSSNTSNQ